MLPGEGLFIAVGKHIAAVIADDGVSVMGNQQVAPTAGTVVVCDSVQCFANSSGSIGILRFGSDVTAVIISPAPGFSCFLVILSQKLVGGIVDVSGGISTVTNRDDVTVLVVGVSTDNGSIVDGE